MNNPVMKAWIHALRLRTLPLSIAGIVCGSFYAIHTGHWNGSIFTFALSTTLLFQILSNLANDLGDSMKGADNENRIGPTRAVQSGLISQGQMKFAVVLTSALSILSALALIYASREQLNEPLILFYTILAVICIIAAITYTVGKKAYGYHGLGDVFVFLFFGFVSVMGVYPLFSGEEPTDLIWPAITIGAFSSAVLNLNNMRDFENDAAVGKRTLVVKIGLQKAKTYHSSLVFIGMASWVFFLFNTQQWWACISFIPFIPLIKHLIFVWKNKTPKAFDPHLKIVAMSTFFVSLLFALGTLLNAWN
jgi:1,4-dihydroxy-2-naphthoate octaprenyltransferase